MKEQIKKYQSKLITLIEDIKNTTGANEVRINANSSPYHTETRINLEFCDMQEINLPKTSCHG